MWTFQWQLFIKPNEGIRRTRPNEQTLHVNHSSIEPDEAELLGADETETRLYFPQMCMMNTDPMNIKDNTKTGTGPILLKLYLVKP